MERVKQVAWISAAVLLVGVNLYFLGRLLGFLLPVLLPFALAVILSLFLEPGIKMLQQYARFPRSLAVVTMIMLLFSVISSLLTWGVWRLTRELGLLSTNFPFFIKKLQDTLQHQIDRIMNIYGNLPPSLIDYVDSAIQSVVVWLKGALLVVFTEGVTVASEVPGGVLIVFITIVATYFISRDKENIRAFWLRVAPAPWGQHTVTVGKQVFQAFLNYLRAQIILVSITTIISILGLMIIGVPYAVTVGLLVGFFDLIPVLGPSTVFLPWILWLIFTGGVAMAWKVAVVYGVVITVRQLLEAKVVSANLGLHPLAVLAAMYVGLKIMGVMGLILGPIVLIIVQAAGKAVMEARQLNKI
ncbi:MAG: sporulation integral membrane protein YtvI [Peptococcaceae bacterium]|nr:sporulation integral membrane protein YtvI [Peptococcaceae bacterium]